MLSPKPSWGRRIEARDSVLAIEAWRLLKGWEKYWRGMAERFVEVKVEAVERLEWGGEIHESRIVLAKRRGQYRFETGGSPREVWLWLPPEAWHRRGEGAWRTLSVPALPGAAWDGLAGDAVLIAEWHATPSGVRRGREHSVEVVMDLAGGGRLVFEGGDLDHVVRRITERDAAGQTVWEEDRRVELRGGLPVLLERTRRIMLPRPGQEHEVCAWRTGSGSVMNADLVPEP